MKITFAYRGCENLGVEYLSACLKKAGHTTSLAYDPNLFDSVYYAKSGVLDRIFNYRQQLISHIIQEKPDLLAFSVVTDDYLWARSIAREVKKKIDVPVVFGGIHPTFIPEKVLANPCVDYVCVGEGEQPLVKLADALQAKNSPDAIEGLGFKKNNAMAINPPGGLRADLDSLPFPDKELFHREYKGYSRTDYTIMTSRGCHHSCSYCYNNSLRKIYKKNANYVRRRSVENVIDELRLAKEKFNPRRICFYDDIFISDKEWLHRFSTLYEKHIQLPNFCFVHPAYVDQDIVASLKKMNCAVVAMGVQSVYQKTRKEILLRHETDEDIARAINLVKKSGIFLSISIIPGLPGQTEKEMEDTITFLNEHPGDHVHFLWLRYYPQADIVDIAKNKNILNDSLIEKINDGDATITGYSLAGNLRPFMSFILIAPALPRFLRNYLVRKKIYRRIPGWLLAILPLYYELTALMFFSVRKILSGKESFRGSGVHARILYYAHYMAKKCFGRPLIKK